MDHLGYLRVSRLPIHLNPPQYFLPYLPPPLSKPGGGDVTEQGVEPTSSGCMTGDRTTDLKRSAVISDTGIHRLIYRDILERLLTTPSPRY